MSIYSDDDSDDIDPANRPGGGLQSEKSPNILARSDVKPILPYQQLVDRENAEMPQMESQPAWHKACDVSPREPLL